MSEVEKKTGANAQNSAAMPNRIEITGGLRARYIEVADENKTRGGYGTGEFRLDGPICFGG